MVVPGNIDFYLNEVMMSYNFNNETSCSFRLKLKTLDRLKKQIKSRCVSSDERREKMLRVFFCYKNNLIKKQNSGL